MHLLDVISIRSKRIARSSSKQAAGEVKRFDAKNCCDSHGARAFIASKASDNKHREGLGF
jgi:hypothetical protein